MRRIITIVTTLCLALAGVGLAATANANQEAGSNGTTYDGTNGSISCSLWGSVTVTNNILSDGTQCLGTLEVPMGVTTIGPAAFAGATELISITLPTSITTIGANAFAAATSLTSITLPTGVTSIGAGAFDRATSLTSITFAQGSQLTSIGASAFAGATSLTSITIPKNVATIGANAFAGATSLSSIIVDSDNTRLLAIEGVLFNKLVTSLVAYPAAKSSTTYSVPEGVRFVKSFNGATALTSVTIPASVTSIESEGFNGTKSLTSITVDSSNTNYSSSAGVLFNKLATTLLAYPAAKSGTSYDVPTGVTSIDTGAFYGASSLTSVNIPSSVTTLSDRSFSGATSLASITLSTGLTTIGAQAFSGATSLTSVTLPTSVTTIGVGAFSGATSLTSVTVDSSNTNYASSAGVLFNKLATTLLAYPAAKSGTSYALPSGVTTIDRNAFYGATLLTNVIIPTSVTGISDSAFSDATSLRNFYFLGAEPSLEGLPFKNVAANAKAYIKSGTSGFSPAGEYWNILVVDTYDYFVTYSSPDGTAVDPGVAKSGSAVQTAATLAPRVGYTLMGWSATDGGSLVTFPYTPSADILLYAKWKKNPVAAAAKTLPSVTGKAISNAKGSNKLTAKQGVWTGEPAPSFKYQWYSCSTQLKTAVRVAPKSCKSIAKATKPTLAVIKSLKGKFLAVAVTGSVAGTTPTVWLSKSTTKVK